MWGTSSPDGKLTGDLGNAIESTEIDGRRSRRPLAGKLSPGDFRLLQQYRPVADARVAGTSVCNWIKFRRQSQARLTVVGGATVARVRRPLPRKAAVAADMVRLPPVTPNRHAARCQIAGVQSYNSLAS